MIKQRQAIAWGVIAVILLAALARPAAAHVTGTPHLINAPAGEYLLTVWTAPDPPRVNDFHVIVGVTRPDDPSLVLNERVMIRAAPINGRQAAATALATHEQSDNKFLYEAYLEVTDDGLYEVTVTVGEAGGGANSAGANSAAFTVNVESARWNWQSWLFWAGLLALVGWLTWRNLPTQSAKADRRRPTADGRAGEGSPSAVGGQRSN
jgi:hypothetical protein